MLKHYQAVEKRPSTAVPSFFVVAAYLEVRFTSGGFRGPCICAFLTSPEKTTVSKT